VINQGDTDATNVAIYDYVPTGMTFVAADNEAADTGNAGDWTDASGDATYTIATVAAHSTETVYIILALDAGTDGNTISNAAEISSATGGTDIDSTPDSTNDEDPVKDDVIDEDGLNNPGVEDEDDHDASTFSVNVYDLALRKRVGATEEEVLPGTQVTYTIEVINQSELPVSNVVVTEYVPTNMTYDHTKNDQADIPTNPGDWTQSVTTTPTITIPGPIAAFGTETVKIHLDINGAGTEGTTISNYAEISDIGGLTDVDSTPDNNSSNDVVTIDDVIDEDAKADPNTFDEDDFDKADVPVEENITCLQICDADGNTTVENSDLNWIFNRRGKIVDPAGTATSGDCTGDGILSINDVRACIPFVGQSY
jgi:uncharacterized repeat protein (TIGR01451 family)